MDRADTAIGSGGAVARGAGTAGSTVNAMIVSCKRLTRARGPTQQPRGSVLRASGRLAGGAWPTRAACRARTAAWRCCSAGAGPRRARTLSRRAGAVS
jgi:hypothetical protein